MRWEEAMLEELARAVTFPPAPDLRPGVLARIERAPARGAPLPAWRFVVAAVAVVTVVAALSLLVSRDARDAVAGFLGLAVEGERIEVLPAPPPDTTATPFPTAGPTPDFEQFARKVDRAEAERLAGPLAVPRSLGEPSGFYLVTGGPDIVIADFGTVQIWQMHYTGEYFIGKGIHGGGTVVQEVTVGGHAGYWVSGGERLVSIASVASGAPLVGTERTVEANALLWASDGYYHRSEGAGTLEEAMRLAAEMK